MSVSRVVTLFAAALLLVAAGGCSPLQFVVGISPGDQRLTRTTVHADPGFRNDRVALIDISGMIVNAEKPALLQQGENPVSLLHEQLAEARADSRVKAVILRMNTPGGTVTASDAMYRQIRRFRQETGKPVVALMMDVTASGGYYVACSADHIVAYPTAITGSVGVIVQTISVQPALARLGVQTEALVSGDNKQAGSPLTTLSESHREVLQRLVDNFYDRFVAVVREARPMIDEAEFATVTDGRVMSGADAYDYGLVDATGDLYDAFDHAKALAGLDQANLVRYHRPLEYVGSPYASAGHAERQLDAATQINLLQLNVDGLAGLNRPAGVYYLWRPDLP